MQAEFPWEVPLLQFFRRHRKAPRNQRDLGVCPRISLTYAPSGEPRSTDGATQGRSGLRSAASSRAFPAGPADVCVDRMPSRRAVKSAGPSRRLVDKRGSSAARYPDVAAEWHPTRNGPLSPRDVTAGTARTVWWVCVGGRDHVWQASVVNRARCGLWVAGCGLCGLYP